jgi:hypothetical protein
VRGPGPSVILSKVVKDSGTWVEKVSLRGSVSPQRIESSVRSRSVADALFHVLG